MSNHRGLASRLGDIGATMKNAESAILAWCRSNPPGMGTPCMRNGDGELLVIDANSTEPMPEPRYPGHRRSRRLATGATWEAIAADLGIEY